MLPPHHLCLNCGIIITDSGSEPRMCTWCNGTSFIYIGYDGEYDGVEVRAENGVLFDPSKFSPEMKELYWRKLSASERLKHQQEIDELNEKIKESGSFGLGGNLF